MNRIAGISILMVGAVFLLWGLSASRSLGSLMAELFATTPIETSLCLILSGGLLTAIGAGTLFYPART